MSYSHQHYQQPQQQQALGPKPELGLASAAAPGAPIPQGNNNNNNSSASTNSKTQHIPAMAAASATTTTVIDKTTTATAKSHSSLEASHIQQVSHGYKHVHQQNIATQPIISSLSTTNSSAPIISPSLAPLSSSQHPPYSQAQPHAQAHSYSYYHPSSVLQPLTALALPALQALHSLPPTQSPPPQGAGAATGKATANASGPSPSPSPMALPHITTLPAPVAANTFHPYHPSFIQNIGNVQFQSPTYLGQYAATHHHPSLQPQNPLDPLYELQRTNQELRDELRMAYNSIETLKSQIIQLEDKEKDPEKDRDRDPSRRNTSHSLGLHAIPSASSPLGQAVVHQRFLDVGLPYPASSNAQPPPAPTPPPGHQQKFHYDFNALPKSQPRYWTPDEHQRFLEALEKYGSKDVRAIANHVRTRNATQVRTHAQKYFLRVAKESKEHIILNDSKQRSMSEGDLTRIGRQLVSKKQSYKPEGQDGQEDDHDQEDEQSHGDGHGDDHSSDHDEDHDHEGGDAQSQVQSKGSIPQPADKEAEQPATEAQPKQEDGSAASPSGPAPINGSLAKPSVGSASPARNANGESSSSQVKVAGSEKRSPILQGTEQYHAHHIHVHQQQQQAGQHQGSGTSSSVSNPRAGGINILSFVASSRDNPPPRG